MKRIRYYDVLRVVCFCFIVYYHMMIQLYLSDMFAMSYVDPFFSNANMHIAMLSVTIFFMLSGAGLAISTKDKIVYRKFYIKRFAKLLLPYYLVYVLYYLFRSARAGSLIDTIPKGIAPWKFILTVFGMDGWLSIYDVTTFYQGIGEWFLGCLLILYLLFPLFRICMKKCPWIFLGAITVVYVVIIAFDLSHVAIWYNIIIKGYEFILGMYLGIYGEKISQKVKYVAIPVVLFFFLCPWNLPISLGYKITIFALAFYLTFSAAEPLFQKCSFKVIAFLSACSYELFLVHHIIITDFTNYFKQFVITKWWLIPMFLIEGVLIVIATLIVKFISDKIVTRFMKVTKV